MEFFDPARGGLSSLSLASGAVKGWDRRNGYYLLDAGERGQALQVQHRRGLRGPARAGAPGRAARLGRGRNQVHLRDGLEQLRRRRSARSTPSKASSPTSSGATARPTPPPCARTWRATAARSPAPTAKARACAREARHVLPGQRARGRRPAAAQGDLRDQPRTLRESSEYFEQPEDGRAPRPRSPTRWCARSASRLKFLNDVGLNYLSLDRSAETLIGRRVAAHPPRLADRLGPHRRDVRARRAQHRPAPARQRPPDRHARGICATSATACWWSSTTRTRSARPTTSSTWGRAPASTAGA